MKTKVLVGILVLTLTAAAVVKVIFFPSIKDAWFAMDERSLQQAPAGLILVRPTHFAYLRQKGILRTAAPKSKGDTQWIMGRNVPLRDVIAAAYDRNLSRVVLPADVPPTRFDFLMTAPAKQLPRFQEIVRHKPGYTAQLETRNTDVLALKIANPALPGLKLSNDNEKRNGFFRNEKLHFTHMPLALIVNHFGRSLDTPVVDKTGLTNSYNFSFAWNDETIRHLQDETTAREALDKIIAGLGLKLEPDTASLEMLVVKKAD
jgi:uncharacterized protein (TIGR03435 family)